MTQANKIASMTGFASKQVETQLGPFNWEIKSLNGKGLDVRLRLPNGFEAIDADCHAIVKDCVKRGTVHISLKFEKTSNATILSLNKETLMHTHNILNEITQMTGATIPDAASVLSIKGVANWSDGGELQEEQLNSVKDLIITGLKDTLSELVTMQQNEGSHLASFINAQLDKISQLTDEITKDPSRSSEAIGKRLAQQIKQITQNTAELDSDRLMQEVALLATKADLAEELDRINSHIKSARNLLKNGGLAGRRLDFLAQEFNREANTICSKSNSANVSALGVELKITIDQMREQVQNIQ